MGQNLNASEVNFVTEVWKPFNFLNDSNQVTGFSTEIIQAISSKLNINPRISLQPWSRSYLDLKQK